MGGGSRTSRSSGLPWTRGGRSVRRRPRPCTSWPAWTVDEAGKEPEHATSGQDRQVPSPGSTPGGGPGSQPDEKSTFSVGDTRARSLKERYHQQYLHKVPNGYCG